MNVSLYLAYFFSVSTHFLVGLLPSNDPEALTVRLWIPVLLGIVTPMKSTVKFSLGISWQNHTSYAVQCIRSLSTT